MIAKVERIYDGNDNALLITSDTGGKSLVERDNINSITSEFLAWEKAGGVVQPKPPWEPTLAQAQARRINEIRIEARKILSEHTDWYVVRKYETGAAIPAPVTSYRTAIRQSVQDSATSINALATINAVRDYKPVWPEAPGE